MHRIPARAEDTSAEADRVQVDLLRAASIARRLHLACSLSAAVISLARRALERADPAAGQTEWHVRFADLHYGPALAASLRETLMRPDTATSTSPR